MDGRPGKAAAPSRRAGQQAQEDAAARSGRADGRRTDRRNGRQTEDRDDGTELGSHDGGSGRTAPRGAATGSRRGLLLRRAAAPPPTTAAGRAEMRTDGCCCCYDAPAVGRRRWTGAKAADLPGGRLDEDDAAAAVPRGSSGDDWAPSIYGRESQIEARRHSICARDDESRAVTQLERKMGLGLDGDAAPRSRSMLPGAAQRRRRVEDRIELRLGYHVTI